MVWPSGTTCRGNLIRIWVASTRPAPSTTTPQAADLLQEYEAKIAALERLVGRQALEIEFLKGALKQAHRGREARLHPSITGPAASPSRKDAG